MLVDLIIRPGQLLNGAGHARSGVEVVIRGDRILEVRKVQSSPGDNQVIDAPAATLMPGLIDLHMHAFQWGQRHNVPWEKEPILEAVVRGVRNAARLLDQGVTTVRDVGSRDNLSIQLRDVINSGAVVGPRFFASGTRLQANGRANFMMKGIDVLGADGAREAARAQVRAGADWLKIMATSGVGGGSSGLVGDPGWQELTEPEIRAAVVEAHAPGRYVTAHAIGNSGVKAALRAGVDCIEHGNYLDNEAIELMLANDVSYVPTLIITRNLRDHGVARGFQANVSSGAGRALEAGFESVAKAYGAGVRIGAGSDVDDGETVADEVGMLIEAGLKPMDAISAATGVAARILHREDEFGTIAPSKIADLILVNGDPTKDPRSLGDVTHVIQGGKLVKAPSGTTYN